MLTFNLKKEWYDKIKSGEKTVEYREVKPYWSTRLKNEVARLLGKKDLARNKVYTIPFVYCTFRCGYKADGELEARITKIEIVDGKDTDLKIDKPVYAIHFELIGDANNGIPMSDMQNRL